ncbi:mce related protein [Mycobacterium marinum]|uniref:Mce related protein n=2 Tax=Mycobacterium marinum TaxID=1781 RepID=A0A2Z5YLA8_MYCMR|nr:MCE family protein [Mycobacterium marinum]AXN46634.1 mce related protein [Mycobacterium marinum]AXN52061.1 mce related protein [Mycobacterium marinum]EPQ73934.1 Mce [Mycobacterium marinum str. Europe]MDC8973657.1 MCE family protein [Mycobacterium marinum]QQW32800.1 MCE family protein [Mycobacterium marinum]
MSRNLGPNPMHRSETASAATPVAASPGRHFGVSSYARPLAGLATVLVIALIVAVAVGLFRGDFTQSVPVTVVSPRAGLVMNPDAKVKMRGVEVGKVAAIDVRSNGDAVLHLAMDPSQIRLIPSNVLVDIASTSVFGAKFVELVPPEQPSSESLQPHQVLEGKHVTVEVNTVFQQLTSLLSAIDPAKLNETLGAIASAVNGRGHKIGQMLSDLDAFLAKQDPSLPALSHDLAVLPVVSNAYADAAQDLVNTAENAIRISKSIVDEQQNLDAFLISSIGLADVGNDVVGGNRQALTDVLDLLVPTSDLLYEYRQALWCGISGSLVNLHAPPLPEPMIKVLVYLGFGAERYRYPSNLPKVAATGGPQCYDLPLVPFDKAPPFVVADVGANPMQYGNPQLLLNSDALKQLLYGPIDGPPRNTMQIGQPG